MARWTYAGLERMLDEFGSGSDPSDPKGRKRLRILRAATELFVKHGYRRTSVDEIARHAHVAKGTVYLHFGTKADILLHAIAEEKKRYLECLRAVLRDDVPPRERLRMWLRTALVVGTEMPLVSKLITGDREVLVALEEMDADLRDRMEEAAVDFAVDLLDLAAAPHGWTPEELRDRAKVILTIRWISGLIADERVRQGLSVERFAEILADMLVDGVDGAATGTEPNEHASHQSVAPARPRAAGKRR